MELVLHMRDIPLLAGAAGYAAAGHTPGGTQRNADHVAPFVRFADHITDIDRLLLCDPQTSGGLLAAVASTAVERAHEALAAAEVPSVVIGKVIDGRGIRVE